MKENKISLCSLAYNSQNYISQTLGNLKPYVDEICVLVDDRTTDNTVQLLDALGVRWEYLKWRHNFGWAKTESVKRATGDWIIWLDDDEKISKIQCPNLIAEIKAMPDDVGAIKLPRKHHYPDWSEDEENYEKQWYPDYHLQAFRNIEGLCCSGRVHEGFDFSIQNSGLKVIIDDNIAIHHHAFKGNRELNEAKKHYYFVALTKLPDSWNVGNELPEGVIKEHLEGW